MARASPYHILQRCDTAGFYVSIRIMRGMYRCMVLNTSCFGTRDDEFL